MFQRQLMAMQRDHQVYGYHASRLSTRPRHREFTVLERQTQIRRGRRP
jgi:hypothetical protein